MDPVEIITPSGYKVFLRSKLTFGEYRQIEKIQASVYEIDSKTRNLKYSATAIYDAEDYALKRLVQKIVDQDGKEYIGDSILEFIDTWDKPDGDFLYKKINEITAGSSLPPQSKKK